MNVFEEKVRATIVLPVLMGVSAVLLFAVIISPRFGGEVLTTQFQIITTVILAVDIAVLMMFWQLKIKLTETELIFGFGPLKKKVKYSEIDHVEMATYTFANYWGYGIRVGRDKSLGYVPKGGPGVKVFLKNKVIYFLSSNKAEELAGILKGKLGYGSK